MRGAHRPVDHIQHRGMMRLEHIRNQFVCAVHGERELDQVVRPDTEEVHFFRQRIDHHHGGGNFDHGADLDVRQFLALVQKFRAAFLVKRFCLAEFRKTADHREHNAQVSFLACQKKGLELFLENVLSR